MNTPDDTPNPLHDRDAEKMVLGALFVNTELMPTITKLLTESPAAFFTTDHQLIYEATVTIWKNTHTTDVLLIANHLKTNDKLKRAGGPLYLYDLQARIVETTNTEFHAQIIRDNWIRRTLKTASTQIAELAENKQEDLTNILNQAQQQIFKLSTESTIEGFTNISPLINDTLQELEELYNNPDKMTGLQTQYQDYDALTEGLHIGETTVIAARPSVGKTTLALNIAANIAQDTNLDIAIFSLEMTRKELVKRILARQANVTFTKIRAPRLLEDNEWPKVTEASQRLVENSNIHINDDKRIKMSAISSDARKLKANNPELALVIIDYIQLIRSDKDRELRDREVAEISNEIKALAAELELPIIAISQLNRAAANPTGADKSPQLHQLRESGAIEQDADNVIFLYRDPLNNNDRLGYDIIDIIIRKQRNGPQGKIQLEFHKDYMRFSDLRIK